MAITWTVIITPIDVVTKTASITAVRVDDSDGSTETHAIMTAVLNTQEQKTAALDQIWQMHLDYQTKQAAIADYIGGLEATAKANLEAREV
jgi:hypothetical protein